MVFDKKAYDKAYQEKNREKIKAYNKEYYEKNTDKIKQNVKKYRDKNTEKYKEYQKEYKKEYYQTENCKKSYTISNWKKLGLIHEDYDALYEKYINTKSCEVCNKVFESSYYRCLDHDHITGLFRQILCRNCNTMDSWKNKIQNNNL